MRNDEKERAEHVMLVDLGRNDLGRVSEYGSVKVKDLMYVERYSPRDAPGLSAWKGRCARILARSMPSPHVFPRATLSGAPKVRAMQIIEELEPVRRGIYGGRCCMPILPGTSIPASAFVLWSCKVSTRICRRGGDCGGFECGERIRGVDE